jgi:hypothetical protein
MYLFLCSVTCVFWIWPGSTTVIAGSQGTLLAWGEQNSQGQYQMHFSLYDGQGWSAPLLLSDNENEAILPAVTADDNTIWVAWTELQGLHGVIRYRVHTGKTWSAPAYVHTGTSSDLAPSLAMDDAGVAWLAFSGSDGTQDDVYTAHWLGNAWSVPRMVHPPNDVPDVLPRITMNAHGRPVVSWQGFDKKQGRYQTLSVHLATTGWSTPEPAKTSPLSLAMPGASIQVPGTVKQVLENVPSFVQDTSQTARHPFASQENTGHTMNLRLEDK